MKWTFAQFDSTRAEDIYSMLELWRIRKELENKT
jgi:hypothetical protein